MTEKRYYHDSYTTSFEAVIVENLRVDDRLAVILDNTYFYPTSGGQPHDTGNINGVRVVDVFVREHDQEVVHVLDDEIWDSQVSAQIDWGRRFDHMQQHSGQHILSAAFEQVAQADTIGFHLGAEASTIDLNVRQLLPEQIEKAENLANKIVMADRLVRSTIVPRTRVKEIPLRKPPEVDGPIRVVEVEKFDLCACGGTHIRRSGEVGIIKIVKLEHRSRGLRVEFRCGWRALHDYRHKNGLINQLANELSTGYWEVAEAVDRLRQEVKTLRSEKRQDRELVLEYQVQNLLQSALHHGDLLVVKAAFADKDRRELGALAQKITAQPNTIALLGVAGEKSHILFSRAENVDRDMVLLLKTALRVLGSTAGGGRPNMAQGGGPAADVQRVEQALDRAQRLLLAQR